MTDINAGINDLIENATQDLNTLNALIQELGSGTPVADVGEQPTFDTVSQKWIFAQTVANDNGEFLGIYKLISELFCSLLQELDIVSFSAPASPNAPARVLPCGADPSTGWTNLSSLANLEGQAFNRFSIRSATAFEVHAHVQSACETVTIDLKTQPQAQTSFNTHVGKSYHVTISGSGLVGHDSGGDYMGDAFYYNYAPNPSVWQAYGSGNGLHLNGSVPSSLPVFSSSHEYSFDLDGIDAPFSFAFVDPSYGENSGTLTVEVCQS